MTNPLPPTTSNRTIAIAAALAPLVIAALVAFFVFRSRAHDVTVGVEGRRVVEIAGPRLAALPFTPGDALAVRIADAEPTAGGFRYDLRYMAFGPGQHDLAPSLKRPDSTSPEPRSEFAISVAALIPEDYSGELYATPTSPIDLHSRYKLYMGLAWGAWALLLLPLAWFGHKKRRRAVRVRPPPSIVDRLRLLLAQATRENLTVEQKADLEALLLAFWSNRLKLSEESVSATVERLRLHPQAGAQWNRVERWIHSPAARANGSAATTQGNIAKQLLSDFEKLN
ncbi:MAG: hypothetical protein K8U03_15465 [Planctomycetia bacterium]|nr:hypothetical protein [Planctomycetia bacterium]